MPNPMFQEEIDAIRKLRDAFPAAGVCKLARRIQTRDFADADHHALARNATKNSRTFYSILSVIRRYDATVKGAVEAARPAAA